MDSVTDMLDSLTKKLSDATQTSNEFVSKLNQLDEIIDDEKRKWKTQMENERNSSITERNKILINEYSSGSSMHTNKSDSSSGSPK